jgi:serine/threonine protein kinase
MAAAALQHGDIFAGRYRIVRELASGGMGAVYEVVHTVTERRCALKVMLSHTVEREQLRKRFMQESRLAAQIGSEYIVDVLDAGVDDETKAPYLVMELLEGEDLGQRLLRLGPLTREETVSYLWHVALALDRTHQSGIVHRDLKASNLFLTRREDGSPLVKVLDFGVAKVLSFERSGEQRTQTVGTPIYMAPEQFRAEGRISPATDIYALGMLAYTLLVGVHYWMSEHERCENPFAFASIAVHGPKEAPSTRSTAHGVVLPEGFDGWFFKATSRWPQDRFPSASAAITELSRVLAVEAPLPPISLPITGSGPITGTGSGPSHERVLPATIESPSARLTGTGAPGFAANAATAEDSGVDLTREQHTEISLSVTSGGLPFALEPQAPRKFPVVPVIAASVLAVIVVVVAAVRSWPTEAVEQKPRTVATDAAHSASTAATPAPSAPQKPRDVTRIEDLPPAPPEPASHVVVIPSEHTDVKSLHNLPRVVAPTTTKPRTTTPVTGVVPGPQTQPKPVDRDSLYGRD